MDVGVVFQQMLILMFLMLIGYITTRRGLFEKHANLNFATLVNYVTVPAMILASTAGAGEVGSKADSIFMLVMAVALYGILILLAFVTPRLFRAEPDAYGIVQFLTVFANNGFMGFPVVEAIFGTSALFYAAIFNIPNNLLIYSLGVKMITKGQRENSADFRTILTNPANIAAVIAMICFFFDIQLPTLVLETADSLGAITSPLAMFLIGASMADIDLKSAFQEKKMYVFAVFRMLLIPIALYPLMRLFIANDIMLGILTVIAAMPGPAMAVTLSTQYGGKVDFASRYVFLSTLISVLTIPFISWLLL